MSHIDEERMNEDRAIAYEMRQREVEALEGIAASLLKLVTPETLDDAIRRSDKSWPAVVNGLKDAGHDDTTGLVPEAEPGALELALEALQGADILLDGGGSNPVTRELFMRRIRRVLDQQPPPPIANQADPARPSQAERLFNDVSLWLEQRETETLTIPLVNRLEDPKATVDALNERFSGELIVRHEESPRGWGSLVMDRVMPNPRTGI